MHPLILWLLLKGQARFDVAHDKSRPFSVVAGNQRVIATGTAFNIDMAGPKVFVTLIEGHVVVVNEDNEGRWELRAGQQLAALPSMPPQIMPANTAKVTAWTIGQIMFDDEPLSSVVEPDASQLRRSPTEVVRLLLLFCGANTYGPFGDPDGFSSEETVSLLLDGLLKREDKREEEKDETGAQPTC